MKRRLVSLFLAMMMVVTPMSLLAGCGAQAGKQEASEEDDDDEDDDEDEADTKESDAETSEEEEEPVNTSDLEMPDMAVSSNVWDVAGRTIVFARDRIYSYDQKKGKTKLLWKDMKKNEGYVESEQSLFSSGKGLILGDKIYFTRTENYYDTDGVWKTKIHLYKMDLDGKGQKSLYALDGATSYDQDLAYQDGILYMMYSNTDYPECFKLDENGDIAEDVDAPDLDEYDYDPSEMMISSVTQNGQKYLFPNITVAQCGKKILSKGYNTLTVIDAATGEKTEYKDQYPVSMYGDKLLIYHYNSNSNDNGYDYGVLDLSTEKYKKLLSNENSLRVFAMDDEYIYYGEPEGMHPGRDYSYLKCDIATGEITSLYTFKTEKSELPNVGEWDVIADITDGKLYTLLNRDYMLSFVGVDVASGDMDVLVKEFYDPGIYDVGVLTYKDDEVSYEGQTMATATVSVLQLDDKFPGAAKINKALMDDANGVLENVDDCYEECKQWYEESSGDYFIPYSFESNFGYISYNDGKIINIVQQDYMYYGGAHGMPYWNSYVFDLETGERLYLTDLISVSEEELDELLVEYATKHMNDIGESYWDGYEDTVRQYGGLEERNFIINKSGIEIYYDPYLLTSFAGGFQEIEIPDEKLKPKFR